MFPLHSAVNVQTSCVLITILLVEQVHRPCSVAELPFWPRTCPVTSLTIAPDRQKRSRSSSYDGACSHGSHVPYTMTAPSALRLVIQLCPFPPCSSFTPTWPASRLDSSLAVRPALPLYFRSVCLSGLIHRCLRFFMFGAIEHRDPEARKKGVRPVSSRSLYLGSQIARTATAKLTLLLEPLPSQTHHLAISIIRRRDLAIPGPGRRVPDVYASAGLEVGFEVGGDKEVGCCVRGKGEVGVLRCRFRGGFDL